MFIRRVLGASMAPSLVDGDVVVCVKKRHYNVGDIIVARVENREVIKRIHGKTQDKVYLLGDNLPMSSDSREYGAVAVRSVMAKCSHKVTLRPFTVVRL